MVTTVHNVGEVSSKQEQIPIDFLKKIASTERILFLLLKISRLFYVFVWYIFLKKFHTHLTDILIPLGNKLLLYNITRVNCRHSLLKSFCQKRLVKFSQNSTSKHVLVYVAIRLTFPRWCDDLCISFIVWKVTSVQVQKYTSYLLAVRITTEADLKRRRWKISVCQ